MRRPFPGQAFFIGTLALAAASIVSAASAAAPPAAPARPAAASPADGSPSDAEAAAQAMALARARLKLTPEQSAKIQPLMEAQVKRLRALFVEYTGAGAAVLPSFLQEFRKTREDFRASLRPILTEPQRAELEVLRKEVDESLRELVVDQRIASLSAVLGLSSEQQAALRPIFRDDFDKKRDLLALYTGPTGGPQARQWRSEDMSRIQGETEKRMSGVLTPAQMQTWQEQVNGKRSAAG